MNEKGLIELLSSGRYGEARIILYERVEKDQDDRSSWMKLAAIAVREHSFKDGVEPFMHLVRISPKDPLSSSGLASCLFEEGEYKRAKLEIERFRSLFSDEENTPESVRNLFIEHDDLLKKIAAKGV